MVANTIKVQVEQELTSYLEHLSIDELRNTTRKQCRTYLEKKLNQSLSKQKKYIKTLLVQHVASVIQKMNNKTPSNNVTLTKPQTKGPLQPSNISNTLNNKRKLNDLPITKEVDISPPFKKMKLSITPKSESKLHQKNMNEIKIEKIIHVKKEENNENDTNQDAKNTVISSVALISALTPSPVSPPPQSSTTETPSTETIPIAQPIPATQVVATTSTETKPSSAIKTMKFELKSSSKSECESLSELQPITNNENIDNVRNMVSLIEAENIISAMNEKLINRWSGNGDNKNKNNADSMQYDNLEYEALKNKLKKSMDETKKWKEKAKKFAALIEPKERECQKLRKENEMLNQNIELLKEKHNQEITKLNNNLKNESENVKEERYKWLRQQKYQHRLQRKYDFVCNKYNIDKDSVVAQMND